MINNVRQPPNPPLDRIIREGVGVFCKFCGSTMSRFGIFGLSGRKCDNQECYSINYEKSLRHTNFEKLGIFK